MLVNTWLAQNLASCRHSISKNILFSILLQNLIPAGEQNQRYLCQSLSPRPDDEIGEEFVSSVCVGEWLGG